MQLLHLNQFEYWRDMSLYPWCACNESVPANCIGNFCQYPRTGEESWLGRFRVHPDLAPRKTRGKRPYSPAAMTFGTYLLAFSSNATIGGGASWSSIDILGYVICHCHFIAIFKLLPTPSCDYIFYAELGIRSRN